MTTFHPLDVAQVFSPFPFGRNSRDGDNNGERFRQQFLVPRLRADQHLRVMLDNVRRLPSSSWLEEAFGGLIRFDKFSLDFVRSHLQIATQRKDYEEEIWGYIEKAAEDVRKVK